MKLETKPNLKGCLEKSFKKTKQNKEINLKNCLAKSSKKQKIFSIREEKINMSTNEAVLQMWKTIRRAKRSQKVIS